MFNRVAIVGIGLLGGSLARDLKTKKLANHIVGVSRSHLTAKTALELGVVDEILPLDKAVSGADLVALAIPMQAMLPTLRQLVGFVTPEVLITDVGSVKTDLYRAVKKEFPSLLPNFVFVHPIAGGEQSGVQASRAELFNDKHVIVTPTEEVKPHNVARIQNMWLAVGSRVISMSVDTHDAVFAKTSHLPHVVAFSLVNYLGAQANKEQLFELAAAGFYDFTRIASSDAEMWRDICITNQAEVIQALDGYIDQLMQIKESIRELKQQDILHYFKSAKLNRDNGLVNKEKLPYK